MDRESRYREVIETNKDRIFRICCGYVNDRDERKDVYQEILLNIWKSLDGFRAQAQISTWIYRVAVNTCLGHLKSERRRRNHIDTEASADLDAFPQEDQHETQEDLQQAIEHLYRCINTLSPVDRALITLHLEDVSSQEIADILGISEANVRVKLHRIRKALRGMLEENAHGT